MTHQSSGLVASGSGILCGKWNCIDNIVPEKRKKAITVIAHHKLDQEVGIQRYAHTKMLNKKSL